MDRALVAKKLSMKKKLFLKQYRAIVLIQALLYNIECRIDAGIEAVDAYIENCMNLAFGVYQEQNELEYE